MGGSFTYVSDKMVAMAMNRRQTKPLCVCCVYQFWDSFILFILFIPFLFLSLSLSLSLASPEYNASPKSVFIGQPCFFDFGFSGAKPDTFRWYKNGRRYYGEISKPNSPSLPPPLSSSPCVIIANCSWLQLVYTSTVNDNQIVHIKAAILSA